AQHPDRVAPLLQGAVVPALDGREAEPGWLTRDRVLPAALGKRGNGAGELAPPRRCSQQESDHGKAERSPLLVNALASCLLGHGHAPRWVCDDHYKATGDLAAGIFCGVLPFWDNRYRACTCPPVMGPRKRSSATIRSVRLLPAKRSSSAPGNRASSAGGM